MFSRTLWSMMTEGSLYFPTITVCASAVLGVTVNATGARILASIKADVAVPTKYTDVLEVISQTRPVQHNPILEAVYNRRGNIT